MRKERSMSGADRHANSQSGRVYCNPQLLPLRGQRGDQLLNFLTEAGAVQPFLAEAPPGFGERHETELMHPEDRRGGSSFPACLRRIERSEEHTSELQSLAYLVCRLLLGKKKNKAQIQS